MELSVSYRVELDVSVVWFNRFEISTFDFEIKDQKETAADFDNTVWLSTSKDNKFVYLIFIEECTFDVEIVDVKVESCKPCPFIILLGCPNIAFVNCGIQLEAIIVEIYLDEKCDSLLLFVLDSDLLGDCVKVR